MNQDIKNKIKFLPIKITGQKVCIPDSDKNDLKTFLDQNKIRFELEQSSIVILLNSITQELFEKIITKIQKNRDMKLEKNIYKYYL